MTRTQIQLPDALYKQAKEVARQHEISLAELVRRGLEHMLRLYPTDQKQPVGWALPAALSLGDFVAPPDDWRDLANRPLPPGGESD